MSLDFCILASLSFFWSLKEYDLYSDALATPKLKKAHAGAKRALLAILAISMSFDLLETRHESVPAAATKVLLLISVLAFWPRLLNYFKNLPGK